MTKAQAEKIEGVCTECKEWTTLLGSCCGAPIKYEGHIVSADDLEDEEAGEGA